VVYPIARGLAPVWTLALAVVVVGASPSAGEVAGVLVVGAGISFVRGAAGGRGAALGLVIAAAIGGYTLVDRYGIRRAEATSYYSS
jgi:drug/metabolite transporter (DMT)-like permease